MWSEEALQQFEFAAYSDSRAQSGLSRFALICHAEAVNGLILT